MSAVASDTLKAGEAASPALVESASDDRETRMTYDETARIPWWVLMVWVCAMGGFAAYMIVYMLPDLARWGSP